MRLLTRAEPLVLELPDISEEIGAARSQSMASLLGVSAQGPFTH